MNTNSKKRVNENKKNAASGMRNLSMPLLTAFLMGMLVFFVCVALGSLFTVKENMPFKQLPVLLMMSCVLSALVGGFSLSRSLGTRGLVSGVIAALPLMLSQMLIVAAMSSGGMSGTVYLMIPVMLVSGAVGGILAVNMRGRRRKRK